MERELLLLGLLQRQDMHGYQLYDFIERYMGMCVDLKKSTAYYLLDKMAKDGFVSQSVEQVGNRPLRTVYHLTAAGKERFQVLLRENLAQYIPVRFGNLAGLAFLEEIPVDEAADLLSQRRQDLVNALIELENTPAHPGSFNNLVEHQVIYLKAELAWLDSILERLESAVSSQ